MSENPAKKLHLLVTVGTDDDRSMEQFETDVKAALDGVAKNVTTLLSKYLVNGEDVLAHEYESVGSDEEG